VPPGQVAPAWSHVRHLILAAMKRGGLSSFGPVEDSVLRGDALLWLAWSGDPGSGSGAGRIAAAAVTELHQTEWRKVCVLVACGACPRPRPGGAASGRSRPSTRIMGARNWIGLLDGIEAYARAAGCEAMRLMGREGWQRLLPSYRRTGIVLERTL
jgi:hypothetical protein